MTDQPADTPADAIDITDERCPMTFVRTKLALGKIAPGEVLAVRLLGAEPLENVPANAKRLGHDILELVPEDPAHADAEAPHRLLIRKKKKPA